MIRGKLRTILERAAATSVLGLSLATSACQGDTQPTSATTHDVNPAFAQYVLSEAPNDLQNRCYLDFGGKVALIGYNVEPQGVAAPGTHVKLTLYWESLGQLGPGWGLFTHLVVPHQPHRLLDSAGPLRKSVAGPGSSQQAFGPSAWEPGKIYVDPIEFDIPRNLRVPEVTVVAGVWHEPERPVDEQFDDPKVAIPGLRLPVLSGPADTMQRGIVLHISTGLPEQIPPHSSTRIAAKAHRQNLAHGAR